MNNDPDVNDAPTNDESADEISIPDNIKNMNQIDNDMDNASVIPNIGIIDTSFPENENSEFEGIAEFPKSYYTLASKERLMLLFLENIRRQMQVLYPKRSPPIMVIANECGVQKFVCSTIKPSAFFFPDMIGSWEECAKFVADFITYEPMKNQITMPDRLMSPEMLLKRRKGNCFEMATLLCSLLTGTGFAAMIVSGYATREVTNNDQRRVECPYIPKPEEENIGTQEKEKNKYTLRDPADLRSKFLIEQDRLSQLKEEKEKQRVLDDILAHRKALEKVGPDPYHGKRIHSWVVIIENAPWCYKPNKNPETENKNTTEIEYRSFFIEPSTGFRFESTDQSYMAIESVWNQYNYYINRQEPITDIANIKWDFQNTDHWEHFLPGEPTELRKLDQIDDEGDPNREIYQEKHLDVPISWVKQLHIGNPDFEERFPNGEKKIFYLRSIYERFTPYKRKNGLICRLTVTDSLDYSNPLKRWEWYQNRNDLLQMVKIDFRMQKIEEYFIKGRTDCIKYYTYFAKGSKEKNFKFFHTSRLDGLMTLEVQLDFIREHYSNRKDLLYYREYKIIGSNDTTQMANRPLYEIIEKFHRNPTKIATRDIATRRFNLTKNQIFLQFHYADNAITADTRVYNKPQKPDYGCEIIFVPEDSWGYHANPLEPELTQLEQYLLLLEQLKAEEKCIAAFESRRQDIENMLEIRKNEMINPKLLFNIFKPLQNDAARKMRIEEYEWLKLIKELSSKADADFLAPYLVRFKDRKLTYEESSLVFNSCITDIKEDFLEILNKLQLRYDEHVSEERHFKKFLKKFHDQFSDYEYDKLIKEGESIEINKRMIQQRLINTKENSKIKFDQIKQILLNDSRLNLDPKVFKGKTFK